MFIGAVQDVSYIPFSLYIVSWHAGNKREKMYFAFSCFKNIYTITFSFKTWNFNDMSVRETYVLFNKTSTGAKSTASTTCIEHCSNATLCSLTVCIFFTSFPSYRGYFLSKRFLIITLNIHFKNTITAVLIFVRITKSGI
jgi:hypothetical protein